MANETHSKESVQADETNALLRELVEANNRTNHAVRAIVLPSTILLITVLLLLPLLILALWAGSGFITFLAGLVGLVGGVMTIVAQIQETKLSVIPATPSQAPRTDAPSEKDIGPGESPAAGTSDSEHINDFHGKCRFCGKPFPAGYYDSCPDCGRN